MITTPFLAHRLLSPALVALASLVALAGGPPPLTSSIVPTLQDPGEHKEKKEAREQEEDTKLGSIMQGLRGDMKRLGKEIESKDAAAAWKSVCSIQQHILDAKQESPESAKGKPDAERAAFVDAFRSKISELLKASCGLEAAILAKKFDDAEKTYREMLGPMQKAGHKQFRND